MITVLFVDDSLIMRQMVGQTLEATGRYRCVLAEDGEQGLEQVKQIRPKLVITDLNMPRMNGLDLLSAIRALPGHKFTPVLLLTTETSDKLREEAKSCGATGWMVKPFNAEKLLKMLEKLAAH